MTGTLFIILGIIEMLYGILFIVGTWKGSWNDIAVVTLRIIGVIGIVGGFWVMTRGIFCY